MNNNKPIISDKNGRDSKGRFAEGNNGRPKGTPNKTTQDVKEFITSFLNDKAFEIPHIWDALDDKDKATLFLHLCKLVLPKPIDEDIENNNVRIQQPIWKIVDNK